MGRGLPTFCLIESHAFEQTESLTSNSLGHSRFYGVSLFRLWRLFMLKIGTLNMTP